MYIWIYLMAIGKKVSTSTEKRQNSLWNWIYINSETDTAIHPPYFDKYLMHTRRHLRWYCLADKCFHDNINIFFILNWHNNSWTYSGISSSFWSSKIGLYFQSPIVRKGTWYYFFAILQVDILNQTSIMTLVFFFCTHTYTFILMWRPTCVRFFQHEPPLECWNNMIAFLQLVMSTCLD